MNFSGTRDTIRYLKTFRVIFNKMPVLLLILSRYYFSCLQMYSEKFFNVYFYEQMFFETIAVKRDTDQFFLRNDNLKRSIFIKKPLRFLEVVVLLF